MYSDSYEFLEGRIPCFINYKGFSNLYFTFVRCSPWNLTDSEFASTTLVLHCSHSFESWKSHSDPYHHSLLFLTLWLTFLVLVHLHGCVLFLCIGMLHLFHWWSQWLSFIQKRMCSLGSWSSTVHIENPSIISFQHFLISLLWPQNVGFLYQSIQASVLVLG